MSVDPSSRIDRLEEHVFFQDKMVQDLNSALTFQQQQIDRLEKIVVEQQEHIRDLRYLLDSGGGEATKPPHYQE